MKGVLYKEKKFWGEIFLDPGIGSQRSGALYPKFFSDADYVYEFLLYCTTLFGEGQQNKID